MMYHNYWNDKILLKDLDKEEFENLWTKLHWVYNDELNYVEVGEEILDSTTSIFYVNTCNGYTYFEDGSKVESVANRMVIFPNGTKHAGTTCSDRPGRIVINFNYHKYYD